ncbi:uncharacterized protein LOC129804753 isoform X2 [Phlebotomus papatasi]|uniref:uncharacterized protein LOC129804753 isoform X2 n=1 Tax=Phlebotomus papatasi TaxID=29031 RepID=UPI0024835AF3|nr:uncharacterized protein LOC129804753 isoform X2 [Phlebotomus papatasi]XP_055708316.1 uncharacterized protein LOC129804753 isoform X2 [Phlebotomus papatasi]
MSSSVSSNNGRKVRFTLPGQEFVFDPPKIVSPRNKVIHGTRQYINGTLQSTKFASVPEPPVNPKRELQPLPPREPLPEPRPIQRTKLKIELPTQSTGKNCADSVRQKLVVGFENLKIDCGVAKKTDPVAERLAKLSIVTPKLVAKEPVRQTREFPDIHHKFTSLENLGPGRGRESQGVSGKYSGGGEEVTRFPRRQTNSAVRSVKITQKVTRQSVISSQASPLRNRQSRSALKSFQIIDTRFPGYELETTSYNSDSPELRSRPSLPTVEVTGIPAHKDFEDSAGSIGVNEESSRKFLRVPELSDISENIYEASVAGSGSNSGEIEPSENVAQFWDFVQRWRSIRLGSSKKKFSNLNRQSSAVSVQRSIKTVEKRAQITSRLRTLRMNLEQVPMVSTLLRAARDANELLLKEALRDILINGITKEDLNSTDKSGRTAISYICSTNLTHFLDIFLQLPGIDVNKPDNEGNTPLHFAAQAGQVDVVNMLLSRSRSIVVDAKNNLGFTPLMKAALQGRTKCAKLLLFAASPVEVDSGRGMRPEQWAKFCGRYSCAEMIEKCARSRLLEKTSSCKWSNDSLALDKPAVSRSRTNPSQQQSGGIRSKFRKVFPFTLPFRDKQYKEDPGTEIVQYLSAAALCASGPVVLPANGNSKIIKSIIRPLEVPKLEVTLANNMSLIRKYENSSFSEDTESVESSQPPTSPSRGKK